LLHRKQTKIYPSGDPKWLLRALLIDLINISRCIEFIKDLMESFTWPGRNPNAAIKFSNAGMFKIRRGEMEKAIYL